MDVQTLRKLTYKATGIDTASLDPEAADAAMRVALAVEAETTENILAGARIRALVGAWRDQHQFKKGDQMTVSQLVGFVEAIMDLVGWYEPPAIRIVNDPQPEPER